MIIKWIMWRNYIRWKSNWSHLKILKKDFSGKNVWKVLLFYELFYSIILFFGSYSFLNWLIKGKKIEFKSENAIFQFLLSNVETLRTDPSIIWLFVSLLYFSFLMSCGIKAAIWAEDSKEDWLFQNVIKSPFQKRFALLMESLVWSSKELIFKIFPIIISLTLITKNTLQLPLNLIYITFMFFTLSLLIGYLCILIMRTRLYSKQGSLHFMITPAVFRLLTIFLGYFSFTYLKEWIIKLPFLHDIPEKNMNEAYSQWLQEGIEIGSNLVEPLWKLIAFEFSPVLLLVNFPDNKFSFNIFLIIISIYLFLFCMTIFYLNSLDNNFHSISSNYQKKIVNLLPKKYRIYYKISLENEYSIKRFPHYMGSLLFWFLVSGFSTIINGQETDSKLYIMAISFLIFFPIYFWIENSSSSLCGTLALESDGKHVLIYFSAGKSLWDVFARKFGLFLFTTVPILIVEIILISIIGNVSLSHIFLILFSQIIFVIFSIYLTFLASIYSPHFEFNNPEQILEYPDRKSISQIINYLTVAVIIPLFMLPTALYLADSLSYKGLVVGQYFLVPMIIAFLTITFIVITYKILNKIKKIDNFLI
ncbi:MAG: hypothetical protein N2A99_03345 [Carnobacterium alterfunditum]